MSENRSVLVLGGARSGKSTFALEMVKPFPAKTLIATLEPKDEEMKARIARHKRERGPGWSVIEEPVALARALTQAQAKSQAVIVDCMTLWLTNVLLSGKPENKILTDLEKICKIVARPKCLLVLVSNEVGLGIVPGDPLSRQFRDLQGKANQMLAQSAGEVYLMAAGIALKLKGSVAQKNCY